MSRIGNLEKMIFELFKIIDDVDTISDIAKDNMILYRALVQSSIEERWKHIEEKYVDELYEKYYTPEPSEMFEDEK